MVLSNIGFSFIDFSCPIVSFYVCIRFILSRGLNNVLARMHCISSLDCYSEFSDTRINEKCYI